MLIDRVTEQIRKKKNPCIVGLDPEWEKLPDCYKDGNCPAPEAVLGWARDIIDALADLLVAVKPQMAFYEVYGGEGVRVFERIVSYAHERGLIVIDDSKRGDIGNTARAYAYAHLASDGPIGADFLTISPFLGRDAMQPFVDVAVRQGKGLFVLVKTSNPGSVEISEARNGQGQKLSDWLAEYVAGLGEKSTGTCGYSAIGAVVGATFPEEAAHLRKIMGKNYFLVPGYGAQGGSEEDIVPCFCEDGLGALVSSSRSILYHYREVPGYDGSRRQYLDIVRSQAIRMQRDVYETLKAHCTEMDW